MKAFVFDVDNTLTPPRRRLTPAMAAALKALPIPFHVAAGSHLELVREQLIEPLHDAGFRGTFDAFVCNGSDRYRCHINTQVECETLRTFNLRQHLGDTAFEMLLRELNVVLSSPEFAVDDRVLRIIGEQIVDRGSMINLAPIGRPARMDQAAYDNRDAFVAFDRRTAYRRRVMQHLQARLAALSERYALRIAYGGQTSFDIVIAGNDKTFPLRTLAAEGYTDLTYFGDALHEGGNDAAVLDFVRQHEGSSSLRARAIQVDGWEDTLRKLGE